MLTAAALGAVGEDELEQAPASTATPSATASGHQVRVGIVRGCPTALGRIDGGRVSGMLASCAAGARVFPRPAAASSAANSGASVSVVDATPGGHPPYRHPATVGQLPQVAEHVVAVVTTDQDESIPPGVEGHGRVIARRWTGPGDRLPSRRQQPPGVALPTPPVPTAEAQYGLRWSRSRPNSTRRPPKRCTSPGSPGTMTGNVRGDGPAASRRVHVRPSQPHVSPRTAASAAPSNSTVRWPSNASPCALRTPGPSA